MDIPRQLSLQGKQPVGWYYNKVAGQKNWAGIIANEVMVGITCNADDVSYVAVTRGAV